MDLKIWFFLTHANSRGVIWSKTQRVFCRDLDWGPGPQKSPIWRNHCVPLGWRGFLGSVKNLFFNDAIIFMKLLIIADHYGFKTLFLILHKKNWKCTKYPDGNKNMSMQFQISFAFILYSFLFFYDAPKYSLGVFWLASEV